MLGVLCVLEAEDIPGILDHHMLEPAAGAEAGDFVVPGIANRPQRFLHVFIGTTRRDLYARIMFKELMADVCG